MKERENNCFQL